MTIKVLIIEDEAEFIEELRQIFEELPSPSNVQAARSRESAFAFLEKDFFDLIVLDLKIPTIDYALDADPKHGHAVFSRARNVVPGTAIFVLTGSPVEDFVSAMLHQQQQVDIWGQGKKIGSIDFLTKLNIEECPARLGPIAAAVDALSDVELDRGAVDLEAAQERLIRIFAKRFGGARCAVSQLSGGLSGAKVVRLRVTDQGGARIHDAVAKLGSHEDVQDEVKRFDSQVSRLDPKATPRKLATLDFGGGPIAGVFYGLVDGAEASAFDLAGFQDGRAASAVKNVETSTSRWIEGVPETRRTIADVRRRLLSDDRLASVLQKYPVAWIPQFEKGEIQTRWACVHGDLHGSNVLFSIDGSAVLIDYGDVAEGPASLDPITLEFSVIFHPGGVTLNGWPSSEQAKQWGNVDVYLEGCPVAEFVRECRGWASRVGAGQREIAAAAYSYLVRQLRYEDTNKELVLDLLIGVKRHYDATKL